MYDQRSPMRVIAAFLACLTSADAEAQYFGQNKVRYADFDFKVMKSEHFDIYYYDRSERAIEEAARLAERWYARLSTVLNHQLSRRQPVILYASQADFQQTTVIPGFIGESTGGVTEALRNRVVLPFSASLAETSHVLGHELVHAFQFDMSRGNALTLPLWFVEGMAEYLSVGPVHAHTALWLRDAAFREDLPGFEQLDDPRRFPYRFGHGAMAYIGGRYGDEAIGRLFLAAVQLGDPLGALEQLTSRDITTLSQEWHAATYTTYAALRETQPTPPGRRVIQAEDTGELNVGPALSPDGSRLVFFSERDLFSIEMFLADATSGKVIRKLTEFATSPHLDSIQFLQSTGAWAPDGRRFAYTTVKGGRPVLLIVEAESGRDLRKIELPALGEAINPTWSPDGRRVAFSGLMGGVSDLFVYDLERSQLQRLTDDLYAQFQPAWSPDGRSIVLVTDRFTTQLDTLALGSYRLALYDLSSQSLRALPSYDDAKHINPRWSADGEAVYFISNPNGVPNVFRLELATGAMAPLTDLSVGVTGITETSPALDVAARADRLVYSVFTDGKYEIFGMDGDRLRETVTLQRAQAAALPPPRGESEVAQLLESTRIGLPPATINFPTANYDPSLGLDFVGAAAATGFNASALGTTVAGGIALQFSDLLNLHQVTGVVDANVRSVRDLAGQLTYLNRSTRWNLGGAVQWVPYVTGAFSQQLSTVDGSTVIVERERLSRQTSRQVLGVAQYPFNRATRLELAGGLRSMGFDNEQTTRIFAPSGRLLDERQSDLQAPPTLNLTQTTGALVYDTSVFGVASPLLGTRSRLEVSPTFGSLNFTEVLVDARRYVTPVRPIAFAGRVLHVGRYGADSDTNLLTPLFLGYPSLVRGYEVGSFSGDECSADAVSECPAFDRLIGSRLFVANAEVRFPIVGLFQGRLNYGRLPVEGFAFGDAGMAWAAAGSRTFPYASDRELVKSAGVGVRVNALGYAVLEFAGVKPFDRPDRSWRFVFNILPGF